MPPVGSGGPEEKRGQEGDDSLGLHRPLSSAAAIRLFRGTLNAIVTPTHPRTYRAHPTSNRTPQSEKRNREAHGPRAKEREEEPQVDYRDVDGIHGSDSLAFRQLAEGSHDERREGEEDARNKA